MSKKAIEILKSKMTKEERQLFVDNCRESKGLIMQDKMDSDYKKNIRQLSYPENTFLWDKTEQGYHFWLNIFKRFTDEELNTPINFDELKKK
jgi:hypothetical protein